MGAPVGNQNAAKAKVWAAAIDRALEARASRLEQKNALDALAEVLLEKAAHGDITALKELGDRLDGKPTQDLSTSTPLQIEAQVFSWLKPT
jgi:hypothetical protein